MVRNCCNWQALRLNIEMLMQAKGMPLTPASFRKHIETKVEARDTPSDQDDVFRQKVTDREGWREVVRGCEGIQTFGKMTEQT